MFSARQRWRQAPRRKASARPRKRQKALHAWTRPVSWENGAINATDLQVHLHDANFSLEFVQQSRTKLSALGGIFDVEAVQFSRQQHLLPNQDRAQSQRAYL